MTTVAEEKDKPLDQRCLEACEEYARAQRVARSSRRRRTTAKEQEAWDAYFRAEALVTKLGGEVLRLRKKAKR